MAIDNLLTEFARAAHNLNLQYSIAKNLHTQSQRRWDNLRYQDRKRKMDIFKKMADNYDPSSPYDENYLHTCWRRTAPVNHPCNVDYRELDEESKKKDTLYLWLIVLYKKLMGAW